MSKTAAATVAHRQLPRGGVRVVVATLLFLPAAALAASPDPTLRRSDQIDLRRLGKVSEDERSVLRVEWRAGLAGVEETHSVTDMFDKLRRLETGVRDVSQIVRNMPATAVAAAVPAAAAIPVAAKTTDTDDYDVRLMVANLAAFALVALWWFRRRNPVVQPKTAAPVPPEQVPPKAGLRTVAPSIAPTGSTASGAIARAAAVPDIGKRDRAAADPGARPLAAPAENKPTVALSPSSTTVVDFSLDDADPETVARENAKLQAMRPPDQPETRPPAPVEYKEDVEPTLQLAEIMLSMGLEEGAAQALIEYTEANPRQAVYHWLKLLGIYRSRGLQHEFAETAEKLRRHFNIQAEEWGKPADKNAPTLENFSRVSEHMQKIWSQSEECISYLRHLLEDNRDGERAGFPQSVAEEILFLIELQKDLAGPGQPAA